jgi:SAM-dependent methyltransferase
MDIAAIQQARAEIVAKHGEWTDHNIELAPGLYTIGEDVTHVKLRRIVQAVSDLAREPLDQFRVLDLACLEGQFAVEFARHGAKSVAIEGREANLVKTRLAKEALGLDNLDIHLDDVRNLSLEKYGAFDIVLCLGILYHLDAPDVFEFIERIGSVCTRFAVFDTYLGLHGVKSFNFRGQNYAGRVVHEHSDTETVDARLQDRWSSIENNQSVWITKSTLINMLLRAGFTSVYECHAPVDVEKPLDRVTYVAIKGKPAEIRSIPKMNSEPPAFLPENFRPPASHQSRYEQVSRKVVQLFPVALRRAVKAKLRAAGLWDRELEPWEWNDPWHRRQ